MSEATLKVVAELAGVAPVTVSRVVNGSEKVAAATREKILAIIRDLDYTPNVHATNLRRKRVNDERKSGSQVRLNFPRSSEGTFIFSSKERRALVEQLIRLRRDLNRLRKHTERIQTYVDIIQVAYSRRLS
jgi:hypothetical protein